MKILVYPKAPNPYQELLYRKLTNKVDIKYLLPPIHFRKFGIFLFPFQLLFNRILGYNIFHLHWTYDFQFPINNGFSRIVFTIYFLLCLILIKLLGYKLIWTVHNVLSHEKPFANDTLVRIILSKLCDAKIVHSKQNIKDMEKMNYDIKNTYTIPIGNYIDVYKNSLTKKHARKILNIKKDNYVILCFGRVEPYKGIEDLIKQFTGLNLLKTTLLIVGPCSNKLYKNKLLKHKKDNVIFKLTFVVDEDVQVYFNAADIVACPFKHITTSSTAILALSFGKPIIAPLIGNIVDIPKNAGFFYNIENKVGLRNSILESISHKDQLLKMGNESYNYAKKISWNEIANQTYKVYAKVISG